MKHHSLRSLEELRIQAIDSNEGAGSNAGLLEDVKLPIDEDIGFLPGSDFCPVMSRRK